MVANVEREHLKYAKSAVNRDAYANVGFFQNVVEQRKNGTVFIDPQIGRYVNPKTTFDRAELFSVGIMRSDNLKLSKI